MHGPGRTLSIIALAAFAATAACGKDPTGTVTAEPAEIATSADQIFDAFGTATLNNFRNTLFPAIAALAAAPGPAARIVHDGLVPPTALGKTYTWNLATGQYSESTRPGAPLNAVRFVLYQWVSGQPAPSVPLVELATVDFVDKGTPSALNLGVIILTPTTTLVDYDLAGLLNGSSLVVLADGVVRTETAAPTVASFDINASANPAAGTSSSVSEFLSADGTRIIHSFNLIQATDQTTLLLEKGATSIQFEMGTGGASGTVSIDGVIVASVSNGSFTPAQGASLSPEDIAALGQMLQLIPRIQDVSVLVLGPFYHFF